MTGELLRWRHTWRQDALASVVVFLVALPLCMGIAIASGMPPATGLITGIIGGLVVAWLAGSPLQVSGPAAGLSVIVWEAVQTHGAAALGIIVLVAGMAQVVAGLLKGGQWFRAVSPAVIHGMLAGIGVLIFASQFHVMVDDAPQGSGLHNLLYIPQAIWKGIVPVDGSPHHQAAAIGLLTLLVVSLWKPLAPNRLKVVPAPLMAVIAATLAAWIFDARVARVQVPANLAQAVTPLGLDTLMSASWALVGAGLAMAFVASAETLLCATAVDKLHSGPRTRYDKELTAQGVGNILCGLLGALPMTGVIVRSSANVEAGGKTRLSAILHGAWLLLFVAALPFVLSQVPVACLAAILVYTGYKLVNPANIRMLARVGKGELAIYAATLVGIVAVNLLAGVLIGIGLTLAKLLYTIAHLEVQVQEAGKSGRRDMHLKGAATVVSLPRLATALEGIPLDGDLHVHLEQLAYIDHACFDLLTAWEKQAEQFGGRLFIDWEGLEARFRQSRGVPAVRSVPGTPRAASA